MASEENLQLDQSRIPEIIGIVREFLGLPNEIIGPETRLREDLSIWGDDGYELVMKIQDRFSLDWNSFDLRAHFGDEGFGPPLPWQVTRCGGYFEPQPLTIADLAAAVERGSWPHSALVPVSKWRRANLHAASWTLFALLAGGAGFIAVMLLVGWAER